MLCYTCNNINTCEPFNALWFMSNDFCINACKDYISNQSKVYKKIANNDKLMRLIYDYFTEQVDGEYSDEEVKNALKEAMLNLR